MPSRPGWLLRARGHDSIHVTERGFGDAKDEAIVELALREDRVIVSADSDFGVLLASQQTTRPSFILFREPSLVSADDFATRLCLWLPHLHESLDSGCVVVFRRGRTRVRRLPL